MLRFTPYALCVLFALPLQGSPEEPKKAQDKTEDSVLKVACIGDSITYGDGIAEREADSYPAQLQKMLGEKYCVKNYGVNAACASTCGSKPYVKEKQYKKAIDSEPDIVIVMLGTNDSKKEEWEKPDKIEEGFKQIVADFRKKSPKCRIILCTPPVIETENWGLQANVVASGLRPLVMQFASDNELECVDVFKVTKETKDNIHADGVHMNVDGARIVALIVHKRVTAKDKKK